MEQVMDTIVDLLSNRLVQGILALAGALGGLPLLFWIITLLARWWRRRRGAFEPDLDNLRRSIQDLTKAANRATQKTLKDGHQLLRQDRFEEAADALMNAFHEGMTTAERSDLHWAIGRCYIEAGRSAEAQFQFQEALRSIDQSVATAEAGEDLQLKRVMILMHLGVALREQCNKSGALAYFSEGYLICEQIDRPAYQATVLGNIGLTYRSMEQYDDALRCFEEAADLNRKAAYHHGEAEALANAGIILRMKGQYCRARTYLQRSQNIFKRLRATKHQSRGTAQLALLAEAEGSRDHAVAEFNRALLLAQRAKAKKEESDTLAQLGRLYREMNEPQASLAFFDRAIDIERDIGYRRGEAQTLSNKAHTLLRIPSGMPAAEQTLSEAVRIFEEIRDHQREAQSRARLGLIYRDQRSYPEAIAAFEWAATLQRAGCDTKALAETLSNLGIVYLAAANGDSTSINRAIMVLEEAAELHKATDDEELRAETFGHLARAYRELPDLRAHARKSLTAAALFRRLKDPSKEARALFFAGRSLLELGRPRLALLCFKRLADLDEQLHDLSQLAIASSYLGHVKRDLGDLQGAADAYRRCAELNHQLGNEAAEASAAHNLRAVEAVLRKQPPPERLGP